MTQQKFQLEHPRPSVFKMTHHKPQDRRRYHSLTPDPKAPRLIQLHHLMLLRKLPVMEPRYCGPNSDLRALQKLKPKFLAIPRTRNAVIPTSVLRKRPRGYPLPPPKEKTTSDNDKRKEETDGVGDGSPEKKQEAPK